MTNEHHHISSLVTDLVEMAQATKRLPELERELREAYQVIDQLTSRRAELERKIDQEVAINTDLAAKLHAAEVARDDAGFRQLEAEDRAAALRSAIESVFPSLGKTLAALDGDGRSEVHRMSAEEEAEYLEYRQAKDRAAAKQAEEAQHPAGEVQLANSDPTSAIADTAMSPAPSTESGSGDGNTSGERATDPTGESWVDTPSLLARPLEPSSTTAYGGVSVSPDPTVSRPTSPSETALGGSAPEQVGAPIAQTAESVGKYVDPTQVMHPTLDIDTRERPLGKYTGKRYADWSYFVSEESWCANGGTHESYWEGRYGLSPKIA